MPIYEYECLQCGKRTELLQRMDEAPMAACPHCGGEVRKLISAPAFQFKGSGFYKTDYVDKKSGSEGKSEGDSGSKPETKSETKPESKPESKSENSKSESKTETRSESKSESKPESASSAPAKSSDPTPK